MWVRDYMTRTVITLTPETEILSAVNLLYTHDISNAPVVDSSGALVGMLSERDCIRSVVHASYHSAYAGLVRDRMSREVVTMSPDEGLIQAIRRVLDLPHRLYPVLEDGELVGVLSRRDVIGALAKEWQW